MSDLFPSRDKVIIYTDGSCLGNPGPGGWGVVLIHQASGTKKEYSGGCANTTNNRMELTAVAEALTKLKRPVPLEIHSDSQYVIKAFTQGWLRQWQARGWQTSAKKPVENIDLWQLILERMKPHRIDWHYVAGHAGHTYNERCDVLARTEAAKFVKESPEK